MTIVLFVLKRSIRLQCTFSMFEKMQKILNNITEYINNEEYHDNIIKALNSTKARMQKPYI